MEKVQIFQDKKVRTHWDAEKERWYFSVVDVVGVLMDSINPTDYLSVTLNLQRSWGQIVPR